MKFKKIVEIGKGAYSNIYLCKYNGMLKAVKTVEFDIEDHFMLKSVIRETFLVKKVHHPNIIKIHKIFIEHGKGNIRYINYIMDIESHNLATQMELWLNYEGLNMKNIKKITLQLMNGVNYLHKNNILHRDLKPENILIDSKLNIKITDFGISKIDNSVFEIDNKSIELTKYVQTLWYRCPEILLLNNYDEKSDMWSIGCILYELITCRTHVLFGYKTAREVLIAMFKTFQILDPPSNVLLYYEINHITTPHKSKFNIFSIDEQYKRHSKMQDLNYLDLLMNLLTYDPEDRYSTDECLSHSFIKISDTPKLCGLIDMMKPKMHKIVVPQKIKCVDNTIFGDDDVKYLEDVLKDLL